MPFLKFWKREAPKSATTPESASDQNADSVPNKVVPKGIDMQTSEEQPVRMHTDAVGDERVKFLDTFTPEEERRIIRKVDYRLLVTIGVIYLVKQVYNIDLHSQSVLMNTTATD